MTNIRSQTSDVNGGPEKSPRSTKTTNSISSADKTYRANARKYGAKEGGGAVSACCAPPRNRQVRVRTQEKSGAEPEL